MTTYRIVRFFQDPDTPNQLIISGLTLEQAQEHCQSEETSSNTATGPEAREITEQYGAWFDGWYKEDDD